MSISINYFAVPLALIFSLSFASVVSAKSDEGKKSSAEHRGNVAAVVQGLTDLAGKDKNIGEEIRQVAKDQESSEDRAVAAMEKTESRGKFKTFFLGTDYKSIGALRSELVTSQNHIDRLTKAKDRAKTAVIKDGLAAQIAALEKTKSDAEAFISANEGKFSIFGWLVKMLNQ